ncbi:hypothetical protein H7R85_15730 (plasmid) [Lactiplantibacillus plantarum]|nr:hypothetical protein H7R85_15730 [Lactiplantibacillus plantarum]
MKSRKMSDNSGTFNGNKVKNMGNVDIKGNEERRKSSMDYQKSQSSNNFGVGTGNSFEKMHDFFYLVILLTLPV